MPREVNWEIYYAIDTTNTDHIIRCFTKHKEHVHKLLLFHHDENNASSYKDTLLTVYKFNPQILELLLSLGCDPNHRTSAGGTPLRCYASSNCRTNIKCLEMLYKHGARINAIDMHGDTTIRRFLIMPSDNLDVIINVIHFFLTHHINVFHKNNLGNRIIDNNPYLYRLNNKDLNILGKMIDRKMKRVEAAISTFQRHCLEILYKPRSIIYAKLHEHFCDQLEQLASHKRASFWWLF